MMLLRFILLCIVCFIVKANSLAQTLGFQLTDGRQKITIPIEIYDNLIVVPVIVAGRLPLKFILDTGVRTTILTDKSLSDALNLRYSRKYTFSAPGGERKVDAYITNNVSLDIPGIHGEGHAMMVLAEDFLNLRSYLGTEVHGILGYELFSRFIIKINYKKRVLEVMTPKKFKPGKKFHSMPMVVEDTKPYLLASVSINDTTKLRVKLLVDTGASHGIILEPESDSSIRVPEPHINSIIGQGLGGVITGKIARIKSLELGSDKITSVIANFPDPNSYMDTIKSSKGIFRNGTLGGEVLSRFTVIFNFPEEKIYFRKNNSFSKKFNVNLSGITVAAYGPYLKKYEITNVREGSAAGRAGVKNGDKIIMINNTDVDEFSLTNVIGIFNSRPGKRINLVIERDKQKLKKEFFLEKQI